MKVSVGSFRAAVGRLRSGTRPGAAEEGRPYTLHIEAPPTADLRPRWGHGRPSHPALQRQFDAAVPRFRTHVEALATYVDDLRTIPRTADDASTPRWKNWGWLIGWDIVSLYGFARLRRPARYVEIGAGESTKVVRRAIREGSLDTEVSSIDPSPHIPIDDLCDRVYRAPLETLDLASVFGPLQSGDIVFVDGSHRALQNSDATVFLLDVLPTLPDGVLVGIHDVYLPDDYPDGFVDQWWSEQYVLAAYLLGAPSWFEVTLPTFYASGHPEVAPILDALWEGPQFDDVNRRGSSFWLEITRR